MAVGLDSQIYSSSSAATVLPTVKKLIRHEGQHIEQHGVADIFSGTQHSLDAKDKKAAGGDVGVSIEELCVRTLAHGVQPQQDFLQELFRIE